MRAKRGSENKGREGDGERLAHISGGGAEVIAALEGLKLSGARDAAAALRIE